MSQELQDLIEQWPHIPLLAERLAEMQKINRLKALNSEAEAISREIMGKVGEIMKPKTEADQEAAEWLHQAMTGNPRPDLLTATLGARVGRMAEDYGAATKQVHEASPAQIARIEQIEKEMDEIEGSFDLDWSSEAGGGEVRICMVSGLLILDSDLLLEDDVTGGEIIRAALLGPDPEMADDEEAGAPADATIQ